MKQERNSGITVRPSIPVVITALIVAVLLVVGGVTIAKYKTQRQDDTEGYEAEHFFFESDLLNTNGGSYTIYGDTVTFYLRNFADAQRISPEPVHYVYTLDGVTKGEGTFAAGEQKEAKITISGLTVGTTYTVAATANSPYEKTVYATFTVAAENNAVTASIEQDPSGNVVYVTVSTTDYDGAITLNWATTLLPDNTDPLLRSATGNSCSVTLGEYSSHVFTFMKKSSSTSHSCSVSGTTVTIS